MSRGTRLISISTVALGIWASSMIGPVAAQDASKAGALNNGMKLSSDQPIQIDSDRLDVHNDVGTATFTGNVTVTQGTTLMKAGSMIVYYVKKPEKTDAEKAADKAAPKTETKSAGPAGAGAQDIDHIEVNDKVYVKSEDQVATGDHGTFDMKTQVLVLTGSKVVLSQGDNVGVGCKLTVQMKSGQAQLESCKNGQTGRVSIVVAPKSAPKN
ncbi:lipopolysaccharide export system protein LptA [Phyllobacterium myrsinacearum]|uniref:LptA/OstA family protein n=1 Tax=Phyllobacterium myrsinacearum TaxID=28101 RepID=UPI0010290A4B|nr:lipopolysaccharide export system protein LptA [Phyllobacterium myrsinacearum]